MIYTTRAQWGAAFGSGHVMPGPVARVYIHHAAVPDVPASATITEERSHVKGIETHHAKNNGWGRIGYTWLVFQSGRIYEGTGWNRVGAHTENDNSKSYGICLVINGSKHPASPRAIAAVKEIIADGVEKRWIMPHPTIGGHRDTKQTECPGDLVYAQLGLFYPTFASRMLRRGDQGEDVRALQRQLGVTPDADFGPKTEAAVRLFQWRNGLDVDGIVGPRTRAALSAGRK